MPGQQHPISYCLVSMVPASVPYSGPVTSKISDTDFRRGFKVVTTPPDAIQDNALPSTIDLTRDN